MRRKRASVCSTLSFDEWSHQINRWIGKTIDGPRRGFVSTYKRTFAQSYSHSLHNSRIDKHGEEKYYPPSSVFHWTTLSRFARVFLFHLLSRFRLFIIIFLFQRRWEFYLDGCQKRATAAALLRRSLTQSAICFLFFFADTLPFWLHHWTRRSTITGQALLALSLFKQEVRRASSSSIESENFRVFLRGRIYICFERGSIPENWMSASDGLAPSRLGSFLFSKKKNFFVVPPGPSESISRRASSSLATHLL